MEGGFIFLDFYKAYDTVDRAFLLDCMEALGIGQGFRQWVEILLRDTVASTCYNGFMSRLYVFLAGVRQGDPLSPLLFLVLMEALRAWLVHQGIGIIHGGGI